MCVLAECVCVSRVYVCVCVSRVCVCTSFTHSTPCGVCVRTAVYVCVCVCVCVLVSHIPRGVICSPVCAYTFTTHYFSSII